MEKDFVNNTYVDYVRRCCQIRFGKWDVNWIKVGISSIPLPEVG